MASKGIAVLKILALCSALGLGGGYVWQRQQEAAAAAEPQPVDPAGEPAEAERAVMPGSKSFFVQPLSQQVDREWFEKGQPQESKERVVLPGSKTGSIVVVPGEAEEPPGKRTVLPGSKSIDRVLQPPASGDEP